MAENAVDFRKQGGRNYCKVKMDGDVVEAMKVKGAKAVAIEQNVSVYALFKQKARWLAKHPPVQAEPTEKSLSQSPLPSTADASPVKEE